MDQIVTKTRNRPLSFIIISIISVLLLLMTLCSCAKINSKSQSDANNDAPKANTGQTENDEFLYNIGSITENQEIFVELIKDNPIDKAYLAAKSGENVEDIAKHEMDFAYIWKKELEYSNEEFKKLLLDQEKQKFESIQKNWERNLSESKTLMSDVFYSGEYQTSVGRMFLVEAASEYRKEIRRRTLYVKYLQYCLDPSINEKIDFEYTQGDG